MTFTKFKTDISLPGLMLAIAGMVVFMGITTAEALYPADYSTSANVISDLGATSAPASVVYQPSASIFNTSMVLTGLLVLSVVALLRSAMAPKAFIVPLALYGMGVLGVGVFPNNTPPHGFFAVLTFVSGGIAAIASIRLANGPIKFVCVCLGSVALVMLAALPVFEPALGAGGAERWVAYPITLWMVVYGGYLAGYKYPAKL